MCCERSHRVWRIAVLLLSVLAVGRAALAATFIVSPKGNDTHPGTEAQPLATLAAARDLARRAQPGPHRIVIMPGEYYLDKTLDLDHRDNGLTIEAQQAGTVTLFGGQRIDGWRRDGETLWCADVPGVKEGTWDFRALVVDGAMPARARYPESGTFLHKSVFDVRWLTSVGGGWERKPTDEETHTMLYDPKNIPPALEPRNAEVRVYHMWDESLVGVAKNDTGRNALIFSNPSKSPPGAFGVKKYVIFNTREGMTRPGQWYLDRAAGRIVYWPLPNQDVSKAKVVAPRLERLINLAGTGKQGVQKITIRGLALQATTTPLKAGGFGAYAFDGAVRIDFASQCALEGLEICNVGGQGIIASKLVESRITDCRIHHVGACAMKIDGTQTQIAGNHIHHVGLHYPSAIALTAGHYPRDEPGKGLHVFRNQIHDTPYSGIVGSGGGHLIEENLISRVMLEMQDGGGIYGGMAHSILRGNVVRDVVKMGEGYGVSAYYLDEGARECVVERNVSIGVDRPIHMHITRDLMIRDNVFVVDKDLTLSFARSARCAFERNTVFAPGKLSIGQPGAISSWKGNVIFRNGTGKDGVPQAFTIDDAMPPTSPVARRTGVLAVPRASKAPDIDGQMSSEEWPGPGTGIDRLPTRDSAGGAPVYAKLAYDDQFLYVAVNVVAFEPAKFKEGAVWGKDEGVEFSIAGLTTDGKPATFVLRGHLGGALLGVTDAGAPAEAAQRLAKDCRYSAKTYKAGQGGGWRSEWAIPWAALGLKPAPAQKIAFNLTVYRSEDECLRCWEGTTAQSWKLDQAGILQLK